MKRKFIIALAAQSVLMLLFFMYAFVQKAQADALRNKADGIEREARLKLAEVVAERDSINYEKEKLIKMLQECEAINMKQK